MVGEGLFTLVVNMFSSPDESTTDLRLSAEDPEGSLSSLTASSTALATIVATNSLSINTSATSSGCSVQISTSHTSDVSDSGYLDIMQCNGCASFSNKECLELLKNGWKPPLGYTFPYRSFSDQQRRFNPDWLSRYSFLRYSKSQDGILRVYCYFFRPNDSGALISSPLSDWKNIGHLLQKHVGDVHTCLHSAAAERAETFTNVASGQQSDVLSVASSAHRQQMEKNMRMLASVLECIKFCGRQGLALREHRFEDGANPGNFRAIIDFRAQTDAILSNHLEHSPRNARYLSSGIQNELIRVCGETIRESLVRDCRSAQFFSVLADETTDVSTTEQLSICVRFVDTTDSQVKLREEFLGFVGVTSTTGENIAEVILSTLESWGLDVSLLRGQGYDGASNMSGKFRVQAVVRSRVPSAVYLHCRAHSLNLAVVHSCSNSHVRNMFGTVQKVAVFFGESAKRYDIFKEIDKRNSTVLNYRNSVRQDGLLDMMRCTLSNSNGRQC